VRKLATKFTILGAGPYRQKERCFCDLKLRILAQTP